MRLFGLVIKRARPINHDLTEEEREEGSAAGVEVRRQRALQRRITQAEKSLEMEERIAEIEDKIASLSEGEEEGAEGFDGLLKSILLKKLLGGVVPQESSVGASIAPLPPPQTERLSDDAIKEKLSMLPRQYLKAARKLDDDTLRQLLKKNTTYDEDTIERALLLFRNENF
jgi:hypothetical protein